MAYGPNMTPTGNSVPDGPIPDILYPRTPATNVYHLGTDRADNEVMTDGVEEQITRTLRRFGFTPKGHARVYQKSYPKYFDIVPYPQGFRVPDFAKFTRDDTMTMYEHIGQFLAQINDVGIIDVHKVRLFPLYLFGTAFNWFTSLAPNSVDTWPCLEKKIMITFTTVKLNLGYPTLQL
jgi:hypothetical protein